MLVLRAETNLGQLQEEYVIFYWLLPISVKSYKKHNHFMWVLFSGGCFYQAQHISSLISDVLAKYGSPMLTNNKYSPIPPRKHV